MFIRNCWYVVAWDHEIPAEGLFNRTVIGEPLLLYRTAQGEVVALEDRCCHRHAPLSKGRREGDCVRCGYHGLKFDARGLCVEVPGMATVPPRARVRSYPVAVRNRWVFVWMGEAERADTALLPDNFSCDHPEWRHIPGYLHYDTPYLLICDNLLDFSHLSYVHEKTLGGSTAIAQARPEIEKIERGLRVTRRVANVPPPAHWAGARPFAPGARFDRWFVYDFMLPGTLLMQSGGRPVEDAEGDMRHAVELHSCQTLTPETETSTHYFFQQAHRPSLGGEQLTRTLYDSLIVAFNEDRDMITAQARNIEHAPLLPMLPLAMDSALVQFRRLVAQALEDERRSEVPSQRAQPERAASC
ncbi:aromatic ring-hydroxylating dioxygenase subunit alpha [Variovorax sp.]|jgi:phenylpropionate dioxygenase-like ring-hydroxylating dioxygenase large terminal subunit|uniref:aromatic ring-hydroxylating dioxygenase subunit alpha n=1 Tax=Variovorax sp. TaxID=1871043 RepID=UPI000C664112|nr:aromatic ring-hydroxylating dioxygenase subunit alpha [Variovorax sp.]MBS75619.1 LysR family transcriptional regulator [Variovorax sp.]